MIRAIDEAWSYTQIDTTYEHMTQRVAQTFIILGRAK
jgi:hypothetical protein